MSFVQVPPAPGSTGQNIESVVVTSSQHRQVFVVGDAVSSAVVPVTSSGGSLMTVTNPTTAVTISNPTTAVTITNTIRSLSSGTVTLSSNPTVISASSGLIQVLTSGTLVVLSASSGTVQVLTTGAYPVLTSGPLQVLTSGPLTISGTLAIVSASSGLIQTLTSGATVISTSAGFGANYSSAAGAASTAVNVVGSTGTQATVTSSGALLVSGTPGSVSTAVNILGSTGTMAIVYPSQALAVADVGSRTRIGSYKVSTSYIAGAAATQVFLGILVTSSLGSASTTKNVAIKDIKIDTDSTAANLNFFVYSVTRGTTSGLPNNGQTLQPQKMDTVTTSSICLMKVLSSVLSSTIVSSGDLWSAFAPRQNTMVGISDVPPLLFGREGRESDDLVLRASETLFVVSTVANLTAYRHMFTVSWDEFTT